MSDDPIIAGAMRRGKELVAAQRRAEAMLAEYEADNNEEGIAEAIGDLAAIRSQGIALNQLHNEHVARNTPQRQPELTAEQKRVAPLKTWQDAASVCGVTQEEYVKGYQQMQEAGKIGEFRRSEDKG